MNMEMLKKDMQKKTREVYNQMKTLEEWIQETRWLMND